MLCAATWMDLETITLSEGNQRKTNGVRYRLCVESKITQVNLFTNRSGLTDLESKPIVTKGGRLGET